MVIQLLEQRQYFSFQVIGETLVVTGTEGNDGITVFLDPALVGGRDYIIYFNNEEIFGSAAVSQVSIDGRGGNDTLSVARFSGQDSDDVVDLVGGSGSDNFVIYGLDDMFGGVNIVDYDDGESIFVSSDYLTVSESGTDVRVKSLDSSAVTFDKLAAGTLHVTATTATVEAPNTNSTIDFESFDSVLNVVSDRAGSTITASQTGTDQVGIDVEGVDRVTHVTYRRSDATDKPLGSLSLKGADGADEIVINGPITATSDILVTTGGGADTVHVRGDGSSTSFSLLALDSGLSIAMNEATGSATSILCPDTGDDDVIKLEGSPENDSFTLNGPVRVNEYPLVDVHVVLIGGSGSDSYTIYGASTGTDINVSDIGSELDVDVFTHAPLETFCNIRIAGRGTDFGQEDRLTFLGGDSEDNINIINANFSATLEIDGGGGADSIHSSIGGKVFGGSGNDWLTLANFEGDSVDGGDGQDGGYFDAADALIAIENVQSAYTPGPFHDHVSNDGQTVAASDAQLRNYVTSYDALQLRLVGKGKKGIIGFGYRLSDKQAKWELPALGLDYKSVIRGTANITNDQAKQLLSIRLDRTIAAVRQVIPNFEVLTHRQQVALVDIAYDIGVTRMRSKAFRNAVNFGDFSAAVGALDRVYPRQHHVERATDNKRLLLPVLA